MNSIMKSELTKLKILNGYATLKTNNPRRNKPMILK